MEYCDAQNRCRQRWRVRAIATHLVPPAAPGDADGGGVQGCICAGVPGHQLVLCCHIDKSTSVRFAPAAHKRQVSLQVCVCTSAGALAAARAT